LDAGDICGEAPGVACDVRAEAVQNAVNMGMTVVVSAGNDGDIGVEFPTLNTIATPGTAPAAITVGASTNSHAFFAGVLVTGSGVPANLQRIDALFGDGPPARRFPTDHLRLRLPWSSAGTVSSPSKSTTRRQPELSAW
jgi:hypothetical protein